jgi:DNA-binding NtrC family response regulator
MTKPQLGLVAVRDRDCRSHVTKALRRLGWTVIEHASGFHVVRALSDVIIGNAIGPMPDLIVVDAISAGCSGVTIAAGFRDLGLAIPIILIAPAEASEVPADAYAHSVILVEPATASTALVAIAKLTAHVPTEEKKRHVQ